MNKVIQIDSNLVELVKSVVNRGIIFEMIKDEPEASMVVATLLEDMVEDTHSITEYCVEK